MLDCQGPLNKWQEFYIIFVEHFQANLDTKKQTCANTSSQNHTRMFGSFLCRNISYDTIYVWLFTCVKFWPKMNKEKLFNIQEKCFSEQLKVNSQIRLYKICGKTQNKAAHKSDTAVADLRYSCEM